MKPLTTPVRLLAVASLATGGLTAVGAVASPASAYCVSPGGDKYVVVSNYGKVLDGKGLPTVVQNRTGSAATLSLSQSESGTVDWSVNGSLTVTAKYSFLAISGSVSATVGGSYTKSSGSSQTRTVSINVPNGQYGILQGGVFRQYTYGKYLIDDGYCHTTTEYIKPKVVFPSQGYAATVNSTGNVPWDQQ